MPRLEAEKTLSACVSIMSSLNNELSEDGEDDDDNDDDQASGGGKEGDGGAVLQDSALTGAPLPFVQTPIDSK